MLDDLKLMLGFTTDEDAERDRKLELLLKNAKARLKILLGVDVPEELNYMALEATVIRFNRIGSEGFASHTVEGESLTFTANDFDGFADEIKAWKDKQNSARNKGGFKFI